MNERTERNETNRCEILSVPLNCNLFETRQQHYVKRTHKILYIHRILPRQQTQKSYAIIIEKWEQQPFRIHAACFSFVWFIWLICATEKMIIKPIFHTIFVAYTIFAIYTVFSSFDLN